MMIEKLAVFMIIVVGASLVTAVFFFLSSRFAVRFSIWTTLAALLCDSLHWGEGGINIGVSVYLDDVACLIVLGSAVAIALREKNHAFTGAWVGFALLLLAAVNFVRGVPAFGINAAGNDSRNALYFFAPAFGIYLMRHLLRLDSSRLCRWIIVAGTAYTSIALLRWAGVLEMPVEVEDELRIVTRAIPANEAFIVAQALIVSIFLMIERGITWWNAALALVFAATALFLQHRSVWAAVAAGLLWLYLRGARHGRRILGAAAVVVAVVITALLIVLPEMRRSVETLVATNLAEAESDNSTWAWRVAGYIEATDRTVSGGPLQLSVGPPSGEEFEGAGAGSLHIHSRFVSHFASYGIVGTLFLVLWFFGIGQRMRASPIPEDTSRRDAGLLCIQGLFVSELVYLIPYHGGFPQGLMLGVIWAACAFVSAIPQPVREPTAAFANGHLKANLGQYSGI